AERRGIDGDAQRQGEHSNRGECWILAKRAAREAHVLGEHFQPGKTAALAIRFLGLLKTAQSHQGLPPRLLWSHACAKVVFDMQGKMALHLGVEIEGAALMPEQRAEAHNEAA